MKIVEKTKKIIAKEMRSTFLFDQQSALAIYIKIRNQFPKSIFLESTNTSTPELSTSYIAFDELLGFKIENDEFRVTYSGKENKKKCTRSSLISDVQDVVSSIELKGDTGKNLKPDFFGFTSFDAVNYFDKVNYNRTETPEIPELSYSLFRFVIEINHYTKACVIRELVPTGKFSETTKIIKIINGISPAIYSFSLSSEEQSETYTSDFLKMVELAKQHCAVGDVFQLVLSRKFKQNFKGDDMNVYRALRSVSPSPYLFYYDDGSFHLFGSSPEAQLIVKAGRAEIHPIAGTYRLTGNKEFDAQQVEKLSQDAKENAEHIMLVDLARNDLNRNCKNVQVEQLKSVEKFSHVVHMVSKVIGELESDKSLMDLIAGSFPAGTLSGAPKIKAIELLGKFEQDARGFYGGCIGITNFENNYNHAIMIRTFFSKGNQLHYRAGAGIVSDSIPDNELEEINNKLRALRIAMKTAEKVQEQL